MEGCFQDVQDEDVDEDSDVQDDLDLDVQSLPVDDDADDSGSTDSGSESEFDADDSGSTDSDSESEFDVDGQARATVTLKSVITFAKEVYELVRSYTPNRRYTAYYVLQSGRYNYFADT